MSQGWSNMFISHLRCGPGFLVDPTSTDKTHNHIQRSQFSPLKLYLTGGKIIYYAFSLVIPHIRRLKSLINNAFVVQSALRYSGCHTPLFEVLDLKLLPSVSPSSVVHSSSNAFRRCMIKVSEQLYARLCSHPMLDPVTHYFRVPLPRKGIPPTLSWPISGSAQPRSTHDLAAQAGVSAGLVHRTTSPPSYTVNYKILCSLDYLVLSVAPKLLGGLRLRTCKVEECPILQSFPP
jgi:hypothetical protein